MRQVRPQPHASAPGEVIRRARPARRRLRLLDSSVALLVPLVVLEAAVFFVPLGFVAFRSLYDWQPGAYSPFVGLDNYATLFAQAEFWQVVRNQVFYLLGLPLWVVAPLLVAALLREQVPHAGVFRTIYFIPAVMSPAIVGLVFRSLLADGGPLNSMLKGVGLGALAQPWLTDQSLVKPVIIGLVLWAGFGTGVLIFSAALSAVPQELFEAARLDGAGFWKELWNITVPVIRPTVALWAMFQVISIFLFMFSWIYVLTSGGPGLASTTMDYDVYVTFMRFGFFGAAAAQSVVLVGMVLIVLVAFLAVPPAVRAAKQRVTRP